MDSCKEYILDKEGGNLVNKTDKDQINLTKDNAKVIKAINYIQHSLLASLEPSKSEDDLFVPFSEMLNKEGVYDLAQVIQQTIAKDENNVDFQPYTMKGNQPESRTSNLKSVQAVDHQLSLRRTLGLVRNSKPAKIWRLEKFIIPKDTRNYLIKHQGSVPLEKIITKLLNSEKLLELLD